MHSSQIYTPGPAMSFFTCFCDLPQKEHFSRSPPSPIRATYDLPAFGRTRVRIANLLPRRLGRRWLLPRRYLVVARIPTPYAGVSFNRPPDDSRREPHRLAEPGGQASR
ncbi:hypothetical protein GCM10007977_087310 [Dactylosporangium sucinum]|uniref:Uncharacterized protein n=1 Tax=Dactylosporangium sucinum TaxID=1424081 RepID=A0A917UD41_9ACTN|nr:hypothetical protein GCM10007977_087310 [Dactylosporangium sucinum]